jgi:hypothetical protein
VSASKWDECNFFVSFDRAVRCARHRWAEFEAEKTREDRQGFKRTDNRQQGRKHADEASQLLTHYQSAKSERLRALALLLRLESLQFLILPLDLGLLGLQLLLYGLVLLLPRLHLIANQGAAD